MAVSAVHTLNPQHYHDSLPPHLNFLIQTHHNPIFESLDRDLSAILYRYLISNTVPATHPAPSIENTVVITAPTVTDLESYYHAAYLKSDLLLEHEDDKGVRTFLTTLYNLIIDTAKHISYTDPSHVQFLTMLVQKIRSVDCFTRKIWDEQTMKYELEPLFAPQMDEIWESCVIGRDDVPEGLEEEELMTACWEYIRFSTFLARCLEEGLLDSNIEASRYAPFALEEGLDVEGKLSGKEDGEAQSSLIREALAIVACQFILMAGQRIYVDTVRREQKLGDALRLWGEWKGGFDRLAREFGRTKRETVREWDVGKAAADCAEYMGDIRAKVEYWMVEKSNVL